jgi:hypothetical protein
MPVPHICTPPCSRTPAHCIEYAHLIQWGQQRQGEEFDTDNEEHMRCGGWCVVTGVGVWGVWVGGND